MIIQDVLIPIDGSVHADVAVSYGIYLASKLQLKLTGLHVIDVRLLHGPVFTDVSGSGIPSYEEFIPAIESNLDLRGETILGNFRKRCEEAGIHPQTKKISGVIDDAIIEEGQGHCDWILLAQRGEHFHIDDGAILGSTTQSVVRRSGKPVLVTPGKFTEIHSLAAAYDGSAPAEKALNLAAELAELAGWPLTVLTIAGNRDWGEEIIARAEDYLAAFSIEKKPLLLIGHNDKELLKFTREKKTDLLVMGAYGHNMLLELMVGSTTSLIIRKSEVPVLLTR